MSWPKVYLPAGGAMLLGAADLIGPRLRALVAERLWSPIETTHLSSRSLAFYVNAIGARPNLPSAIYAFAHHYGPGWRVLYVGATVGNVGARLRNHHKISTAIGYGATHLLVRRVPAPSISDEEAWLIGDLAPPLNGVGLGGWSSWS